MKTVCIIGAGPGGLVMAKTLLQNGSFKVTIYEEAQRVGGIWAFEKGSTGNNYLSTNTPVNLSRFTVSFSDLSWPSTHGKEGKPPMFPAADEVGRYLSHYQNRYVPADNIHFGHRVIGADLISTGTLNSWSVTTVSDGKRQPPSTFDYLVNATGFFHAKQPFSPPIPSLSPVKGTHTSEFRDLHDLFNSNPPDRSGKILLIGGGNSSGETAANVAFQLSSRSFSPSSTRSRDKTSLDGLELYHITPRPLYAIPPFIPTNKDLCRFAPLDLQFYELKWRPPEPISSGSGFLPDAIAEARYQAIHGMTGDQRDLGASALVTTVRTTPYVALSESYGEYVRSGSIVPVAGRVMELSQNTTNSTISAKVEDSTGASTLLHDIVAVIYATGYSPHGSLSFLAKDVTELLEYDPTSNRLPFLLQQHQTINSNVPNLAFVGFYEGPYWGVMEMQARVITHRWSSGHLVSALPDEELDQLRQLRSAMNAGASNVPQYWFSDYVGYLEELARELGLTRVDAPFDGSRDGPVAASRYLAPGDNASEAQATVADMKTTIAAFRSGRYRARAAFRALQGHWLLERRIESKRKEMPSGTFTGKCAFHPRKPTAADIDFEYLYVESGSFLADTGLTMTASRRYVYRYREADDTLSVWFVDVDDGLRVDYLFHRLVFAEVENGPHCKAHAEHLCEEDYYTTDYRFTFRAISLDAFEIQHAVGGPSKDYVATGRYTRGSAPQID